MNFVIATKAAGGIPIISPIFSLIVNIMGVIMDLIFKCTSSFGLVNIGVCIIIFTIVTKILMLPLSVQQAKSQKLMSVIQPQMQAIQAKYKGMEGDQQAQMRMQAEIKALYDRYGYSMSGGCVQMLIQMPILFALYRVILNIPAYVPSVKMYFDNIVNAIGGEAAIGAVNEFAHSSDALTKVVQMSRISGGELVTTNHIVDFLYHLNPDQWTLFTDKFASASSVIQQNYLQIEKMNSFLGLNLATSPSAYGMTSLKAWIIPVLAGLSQYLSSKLMTPATPNNNNANDPTAQTMKNMTVMMPLMSVVFCFSFASGIGVYWIASAVMMGLQQFFMNKYFDKMDMDELVKANIEKSNKKRAKKGLPPINERAAEDNYKRMVEKAERAEMKAKTKEENAAKQREAADGYYKTESIADRARMVQQYNEKHK